MRCSLAWASSLALLCLTFPAAAQEQELPDVRGQCAPSVTEHRGGRVEVDGLNARWFHPEVAACVALRLQALPLYAERVHLLEQRLSISDERDALRQREVRLTAQAEERAVGALEAAERGRRHAEEELNVWWRHPVLWFALGGVVVGVLMAVGGWAIGQLAVVL